MPKRSRNSTRKQRRSPSKKRRLNTTIINTVPAGPGLSECAVKYYKSIVNPWDPSCEGCCVPRHPARPSHKVRGFVRTSMSIGTNGYGFIMFCPTLANDLTSAYITNSTYAGTTLNTSINSSTVGVDEVPFSNLPYNKSQFLAGDKYGGDFLSGRIVSAGVSIQYTGTVSNMGGTAYSLVTPDHSNINLIGDSAVGGYPETTVRRIDSSRVWTVISAIDDDELNYPDKNNYNNDEGTEVSQLYPFSNRQVFQAADTTTGGAPLGVFVQSTPGNQFIVELVIHGEIIGKASSTSHTPTHSDSVGLEMVMGASARSNAIAASNPQASRPSIMGHALQQVMHEATPVVGAAAAKGARVIGTGIAGGILGGAIGFATTGPAGAAAGARYGFQRGVTYGLANEGLSGKGYSGASLPRSSRGALRIAG